MLKKLLALLLLVIPPVAFGQVDFTDAVNVQNVIVNPTMDNCVPGPTCGAWMEMPSPGDWTIGSVDGTPGKVYQFSYVNGTLYQNIDLSQYSTNAFNFYFDFDLNNSCRNSIGGACTNINGPIDEFSARIKFYDTEGLFTDITFVSGTPSSAQIACVSGLEILGLCLLGQEVLPRWEHFGYYSSVESDNLFTSLTVEFTGRDVGFWGGLYGPQVDNATLQINYLPPPYPTAGGSAGMNVSAPGSDYIFIYKGNDPLLFSQLALLGQGLVGWTAVCEACGNDLKITSVERPDSDYLFLYTDTKPINGSWYSFQELPPTVDCTQDPYDPSCVITTLNLDGDSDSTTTTTTDGTYIADTTDETVVDDAETTTESQTSDIVANTSSPSETSTTTEKSSEPVATTTITATADPVVAATNPVAAAAPTSEAAYRELTAEEKAAILADAISKNVIEGALTTIASTAAASSTSGSQENTSTNTVRKDTGNDFSVDVSGSMIAENMQAAQTETQDTSMALDILETGRVKGQEALAITMAGTENSANESVNQAEAIAINSAVASYTINNTDDAVISTATTNIFDVNKAIDSATESVFQAEAIALASIEASKPITQSAFDDGSNADADTVTALIDPSLALAAALNSTPNVMNLQILGVIGKPEEKSDAEKRAEEVVAANQQQMEEINKNYMDADQSGIVAAMGADTDVASYRTAMLQDAAQWYKDKDIYKGVVIKDNVRSSYFLEKGNSDIYKKMVEDQYK